MNSIRTRLLAGIGALVVVAASMAGFLTYSWTFGEALELQDATLWQVSAIAVAVHPGRLPVADNNPEADTRVTVEELGNADMPAASGLPRLSSSLPDGLQNVIRGQDAWRVLARTRSDGSRVAVGQSVEARDDIARGSAIRSMIPVAVLMIGLMLLVGAIIRYSFRPVARLSERLDISRAGHKERLPIEGIPAELLPFIASINRLLDRIDRVFEQQARFIADAAHELRTPIAALSLQIDNLGHADADERARRLEKAQAGVRRTARLIDQLLLLARAEASRCDPDKRLPAISLAEAAKEIVADCSAAAAGQGIDLGCGQLDQVQVAVDPTALRMLIRNLVENAIRHTPCKGRIDVVVRYEAPWALLEVMDSGPGVSESDLASIFHPFVRGRNTVGEGSGLGLAIVQTVADRYDGEVSARNGTDGFSGLVVTVKFRSS